MLLLLLLVGVGLAHNPEENVGIKDPNLFEGDIVLSPDQRLAAKMGLDVTHPASARGSVRTGQWPGGVLVYTIDPGLAQYSQAMSAIEAGMKMWTDNTCIRFKERTNERAYATFHFGSGCSSEVGMKNRQQHISLGNGCWHAGVVAHEIAHALGFFHEQSRPDRDNYVTIYINNVEVYARNNFDKYPRATIDSLGTPYDYGSVMHYGPTAFGIGGFVTIQPKKAGVTIGQRDYVSPTDVKQMNLLYKCSAGSGGDGGECKDNDKNCEYWAGIGECEKNPTWMHRECKVSCKSCCADYVKHCKYWAGIDECKKNPSYMLRECKKSCNKC